MKISFKIFILLTLFFFIPLNTFANYNPSWNWKTIQTDNFTIYYPEGHEKFAQRIYLLTDEVYNDVTKYFGMKPPKCPIVINPGTDLLNGFYSPFPNRISLYETPAFHLRGFGPASDIADTVFTHEFTHFVHITATAGWYKNLTKVIGSGLAISNILSPGWAIEGITTNTETLFTDGGRGRCSYFKGQILSCTEEGGLWNLSAAGTYSPYVPPGNRFYLAGYHMVKYLNDQYGKDAFARISRYQAKHPVGGMSEALHVVTGKKPSEFYKDFLDDLKKQVNKVKEKALSSGLPQGEILVSEKYDGVVSHFWTNDNTILALRSGYDKKNALLEIHPSTGSIVKTINTGRINALPPLRSLNDNGDIVFSGAYPHILANGRLASTDITVFNRADKNFRRITKNMHIYSAAISPDKSTFVAAKRNGMWIDLILIDNNGKNSRPLISKPGFLFEAPVWSPDGKQIVTVVKTGQNSDIALIDPDSGEIKYIFTSDIFEDNEPEFSPDGKWVVFSSNRKGTWNIFAWNLKTEKLFQLTSVFFGATEPRLSPDGKNISFLSLHNGLNRLCKIPFIPESGLEIAPVTLQSQKTNKIDLERINPEITFTPSRFPLIEAYKPYLHIPFFTLDEDSKTFGLWLQGGDPVGINNYSASFSHVTTSDISSTSGTSDEEDSKGHFEYDVLLTNNSFWPTLQIRAAKQVEDGDEFWYKENTVEFFSSISIINQVMPSQIETVLVAGGKYRHQASLTDNVYFYNEGNDSTSIFGEVYLTRFPDYARRDIIPTHGQEVFVSFEKDISQLGGERNSRNAILSIKQFLPSFIKHNGIQLKGVYQEQNGLLYSKDLSIPRGYSRSEADGGLYVHKNMLLSGEYHFPIAYPDKGLGLSAFHIDALKSSVFFDYGAGWNDTFKTGDLSEIDNKSFGGSITCRATIYSIFRIETGIEAGYKTEENESFASFVFMSAF